METSNAKTENVPRSSGATLYHINKKTHLQSHILGTSEKRPYILRDSLGKVINPTQQIIY